MKGFIRPDPTVLADSAAIPDANRILPPPNQFTHELSRSAPYWYGRHDDSAPSGEFPAGLQVILLVHDGGRFCRVADARGLYVEIEFEALRRRTPNRGAE
jgi:hypothetical protein